MRKSLLSIVSVFSIASAGAGCASVSASGIYSEAAATQNAAVLSIEAIEQAATAAYEMDQQRVLDAAKASNAPKEDTVAKVAAVRSKWAPLWAKAEDLRKAQNSLATTINAVKAGTASDATLGAQLAAFTQVESEITGLFEQIKPSQKAAQ